MAPRVEIEPWTIVQPTDWTLVACGKESPRGDMVERAQMKSVMKKTIVSADVTVRNLWSLCGWIQSSGSETMLKRM